MELSTSKRVTRWVLALCMGIAAQCQASLIDFSTIDLLESDGVVGVCCGNIVRIGSVTFSYRIGFFDDGFQPDLGGAYNFFGENDERIRFDSPSDLIGIDVRFPLPTYDLPSPDTLDLRAFNSASDLIGSISLSRADAVQNVLLNFEDVSTLEFHMTGGEPDFYFPGDKPRGWYLIDNLRFTVPEPGSIVLTMAAAGAMAFTVRRRRRPSGDATLGDCRRDTLTSVAHRPKAAAVVE